ncbi:hypothetical protein B0T16DRAFT_399695 [Cercophora newfieldiana]|uniref:Uncharacterized protein n=1 Tax=Cercophora newfieldiana TaxID=92897 RepID=A0AA39YQ13_9PEZI|nr:hypothetical protein B0T16DRAFT_399695 [Cercophora newfieldiana]
MVRASRGRGAVVLGDWWWWWWWVAAGCCCCCWVGWEELMAVWDCEGAGGWDCELLVMVWEAEEGGGTPFVWGAEDMVMEFVVIVVWVETDEARWLEVVRS